MRKKNAIFLLIDGLRYDVFADMGAARELVPNLVRLVERGFLRRCVANAQGTQFVLPALFSLTYPLDHGGYNNGIRGRPKSFVELLRDAGYSTQMMASCHELGTVHDYDRGFDGLHTAFDCRHIMEYLIDKTLRYEVELWRDGERGEAEAAGIVQREMGLLLEHIENAVTSSGRAVWPPKLRRINDRVARGCPAERELLRRDPRAVMEKLLTIRPIFYWRYLGRPRPGPAYQFWRAVESVRWRSRDFLIRKRFPFFLLTLFEVKAHEVIDGVCRFVERARGPWYLHLHLMDVHDCCSLSRPFVVLSWLRFLPRWLRSRAAGRTRRRFNYDLALMFVDHQVGKLLDTLSRQGTLDQTIILVTGDHGSGYAHSPRKRDHVGLRTHGEDIDVPLIITGTNRAPSDAGLVDSMGVSASLLDVLGVAPHSSFKGRSVFGPGRAAVITESAGPGNADLARKDLYFTATTGTHKLMTVLRGEALEVLAFYDVVRDPLELADLSGDPAQAPVVDELLAHIHAERGELLAMRGALPAGSEGLRRAAGRG